MLTDSRSRASASGQGGRGGDGTALHMVGEDGEIVGALGDAEQGRGAELAIMRVLPAREPSAQHLPARHRHLRLEQDLDLAAIERAAQIDLEPLARSVALGAVLDHTDRCAFRRFGLGERDAGAPQQAGRVVARLGDGDAGRLPSVMTWSPDMNGRPIASTRPRRGSAPRRGRREREQHRELGARHARPQCAAAIGVDAALDAARRRLQDGVADRTPEAALIAS